MEVKWFKFRVDFNRLISRARRYIYRAVTGNKCSQDVPRRDLLTTIDHTSYSELNVCTELVWTDPGGL